MATTTLNNPADLSAFVVNYFKPPPKDNRDSPPASAPDDNENDDGSYSYDDEGIDAQMGMEKEDSVITAFNTFLESSPQVVSQLEKGVDVELDDDTDLGLEAISLDQLHASNFFGDVESKGDCILSAIKEMLGSSCPDDIRTLV